MTHFKQELQENAAFLPKIKKQVLIHETILKVPDYFKQNAHCTQYIFQTKTLSPKVIAYSR